MLIAESLLQPERFFEKADRQQSDFASMPDESDVFHLGAAKDVARCPGQNLKGHDLVRAFFPGVTIGATQIAEPRCFHDQHHLGRESARRRKVSGFVPQAEEGFSFRIGQDFIRRGEQKTKLSESRWQVA
jgi:hypothetical protein